jgi:hypothetical protein
VAIADFIHLKVRSAYSLTEGANKVEMVVALAKANAMPAVAVTDRNNLFGALEFAQYASKAGIQPIIGCDLGIRREEEGGIAAVGKAPPADWLTLLVQSEAGYLNLMRLVSRAHLEFKTGPLPALPLRAGRPYRGPAGAGRQHGQRRGSIAGGRSDAGRDPSARTPEIPVRRPALYRAAAPWRGGGAAHRGSAARSRL